MPMIPTVLPSGSRPMFCFVPFHSPDLALFSPYEYCRSAEMIRKTAVVAVASSTAPGVCDTWIPRFVQEATLTVHQFGTVHMIHRQSAAYSDHTLPRCARCTSAPQVGAQSSLRRKCRWRAPSRCVDICPQCRRTCPYSRRRTLLYFGT